MKGFMFTIEAILCIILLGATIGIAAYYLVPEETISVNAITQVQAKSLMAYYFKENPLNQDKNTTYCKDVLHYYYDSGLGIGVVETKKVCG